MLTKTMYAVSGSAVIPYESTKKRIEKTDFMAVGPGTIPVISLTPLPATVRRGRSPVKDLLLRSTAGHSNQLCDWSLGYSDDEDGADASLASNGHVMADTVQNALIKR